MVVEKIHSQLYLPMEWEAARPEFVRKQFELAKSVNQAAEGRLHPARTMTAAGTMNVADSVILANASAGAFTITALDAGELIEKMVHIKKTDASANVVIIKCSGSDTIEGAASRTLAAQYESMRLYSAGSSPFWRF